MSDEIDHITEQQEIILASRLATYRQASQSSTPTQQQRPCTDCLPIPPARLRVNPRAYRCINCQQQAEKKWK